MCVNKNAQTARTNGRSNDEAYLYLSGVVGVVMKRVVLFVVGVHTWPRPGPQALLQDLIVSRQLGSRDTTRLINSHVTQRGNRDLTSRKKKKKKSRRLEILITQVIWSNWRGHFRLIPSLICTSNDNTSVLRHTALNTDTLDNFMKPKKRKYNLTWQWEDRQTMDTFRDQETSIA